MKLQEFKKQLRSSLEVICDANSWSFDNNKHRGMAFEDWCFGLFKERYPASDNELSDCVSRTDDTGIDIVFESSETEEVFLIQCKNPKIAANDPISDEDIKSFLANEKLLSDKTYQSKKETRNPKIQELVQGYGYWIKKNYSISFIFISTGKATENNRLLVDKFNSNINFKNVRCDIWGITEIRDEYVAIKSVEEQYPELVTLQLGEGQYLEPNGPLSNITFSISGNVLHDIARQNKERLFNWNIRRFLGRKGQVNSGLTSTLSDEPERFYYYNNGISALCEKFTFDRKNRKLRIEKFQIVNGAQTLGAIRNTDSESLKDVNVLVKLTAVKHSVRETGIAATLIRTNNTQNSLRAPDFRSNDQIQLWIEKKFKDTKGRGNLIKIVYGRKRPYPRSSKKQLVLKLQDLGKIRYAWNHDPRVPIAEPARLFELQEEGGYYGYSFGDDGRELDVWSDAQFNDALLAIHAYNKIVNALNFLKDENEDLKQIARLKYYGLNLFHKYIVDYDFDSGNLSYSELLQFGAKFEAFFDEPLRIISATLSQAYRQITNENEGAAFSLPRDPKIWNLVQQKFADNIELAKSLGKGKVVEMSS